MMRFATILPILSSLLSLLLLVTPIHGVPTPSAARVLSPRELAKTRKPTKAPTPSLSPVGKTIAKYAPGAYNAFVPGTYQKKALTYVESVPGSNNFTDAKAVQYYALACFFYASNGTSNAAWTSLSTNPVKPPGWLNAKNWLSTTIDPCSGSATTFVWAGVLCVKKQITRISLPSNRLIGSVPVEVALLASNNPSGAGNINYIDLYNNPYLLNIGDTGLSWISRLGPNMQYLYFGSTSQYSTTGVPDAIGQLVNLLELDCSYTLFSGALRPTVFAPLTKLQYLELDGNAYNSSIPTVIGTLPALKFFYSVNAGVLGDLSFTVGMKSIQELWVDQNSIKGSIPASLGNSTTLKSFSVTKNQLAGSFPTALSKLVNMEQAWFYSNKFTGSFPNYYSTWTKLTLLKLENNLSLKGTTTALCKALGPPFGSLTVIGTDCSGKKPKVTCPSSCKICCCNLTACNDF